MAEDGAVGSEAFFTASVIDAERKIVMRYKVLIVEDDGAIARTAAAYLSKWGYDSIIADDFSDIYRLFMSCSPQIVLMDISLPFYNGYYWCERIRKISKVPMIFISSQSEPIDMIMAMNMGADDYIVKPFDLSVLTAKIGALVRRAYDYQEHQEGLAFRDAFLNLSEAALYAGEKKVELTRNELKIFQTLLEHKNSVVTRDELMKRLWDDESFIDDNTLTVNVARLRRKLEAYGYLDCIETKKGLGYVLNE